jgi:hypothetical protein
VAGSDPAAVFVEVSVDDVVAAVLDAPVAAVCFDDPPGVGLLRGGRLVMPQASSLERFPVFFLMRSRSTTKAWPTWENPGSG